MFSKILIRVVLVAGFASLAACSADGGVGPTNNTGDADMGMDVSNNGMNNTNNSGSNNANNQNNTNSNNTNNEIDMGVDMPPAKPTLPTIVVPTSGGGTASSAEHTLTISVGAPQPHGVASDSEHRLLLGPIIPTGN